jgi:amidohydrolase family protein
LTSRSNVLFRPTSPCPGYGLNRDLIMNKRKIMLLSEKTANRTSRPNQASDVLEIIMLKCRSRNWVSIFALDVSRVSKTAPRVADIVVRYDKLFLSEWIYRRNSVGQPEGHCLQREVSRRDRDDIGVILCNDFVLLVLIESAKFGVEPARYSQFDLPSRGIKDGFRSCGHQIGYLIDVPGISGTWGGSLDPNSSVPLSNADVRPLIAILASGKFDVQFGPAGVQWCSPALLETIAEHSTNTGRRVHMHLLETVYQRAWADRVFPNGIVHYLKDIGLLSERLTLAHCIHATPAELDLIAQSGAIIVTNFSSNLHLHSGLAPIADAHRRGCPIAVGVDGIALDEDDDAIRELRLVQMMHGGCGFERTWSRADFLGLAVRNGRRSTGAPGTGELVPGHPADFVVLDLDGLDRDAIMPVDPLDMLFARGNAAFVRDVVVAGRPIVRDGKLTGVDLAAMEIELRGLFRKSVPHFAALEHNWKPFEAALTGWFRAHCGCS